MNAVEIEEAISELAERAFNAQEFPFEFLQAFGHKETTIKKLRRGTTNKSDLGGVLNNHAANIHIVVCNAGKVPETLDLIKNSEATRKAKTKFALATDGLMLEAEDLISEERVVCEYQNFPDHFGFFLSLAGISTVKAIRDNSFDVKATSRLNRLYVQLLSDNADWASGERREDMNHFMARLIFSFFAEDTSIFAGSDLFTGTIEKMSERDASNTHEVIGEIFRSMDTKIAERNSAAIKRWALDFPYVNGGLFAGSTECPKFSRIARSYLLNVGKLDWTKINPDIFGSMIQAVADDEERGELGMHYTSVPNILKVLNPLFLDDLREALEDAGDNARKLLNLRKRIAKIRVFDPACGSGNFLVIAYKELRQIENGINERRDEKGRKSEIPLTNFRGIEIRGFSAEIARLALIIAEYQCDVEYLGQQEALVEFLPLSSDNWITCGNALRLDWLSVCPPTGTGVKHVAEDLFEETHQQFEVDFENEGGETFICGNPPYLGKGKLSADQKVDMAACLGKRIPKYGYIDFVACWLFKASDFLLVNAGEAAFVTTNSINQGRQAPLIWGELSNIGIEISFAHTSFNWSNNASNKAAVVCVIIGLSKANSHNEKYLFSSDTKKKVSNISPYLTEGNTPLIENRGSTLSNDLFPMQLGNKANDGGMLSLNKPEAGRLLQLKTLRASIIKRLYGSKEFNNGLERFCLWIRDEDLANAMDNEFVAERIEACRDVRLKSPDKGNRKLAERPHQFREMYWGRAHTIIVPAMTSVRRRYLPCGLLGADSVISGQAFGIYDGEIWQLAVLLTRIHFVWIAAICGRLKEDYRYSNDLGWNTFPISKLTEKNKEDLTRCAENILLAREAHFPKTIADLYAPEKMPENLRQAHEANDEVLERIYIGRRFRNDTERLEKLFEMYTKMTSNEVA